MQLVTSKKQKKKSSPSYFSIFGHHQLPTMELLLGYTVARGGRRLYMCWTSFPRSTVLTVSIPGSVADTHREQKWYRKPSTAYITQHRVLYKTFIRFLHNGSQAANFNTQRKHYVATQVHRHGLGAGETLSMHPHLRRSRLLHLRLKNHNDGGVST